MTTRASVLVSQEPRSSGPGATVLFEMFSWPSAIPATANLSLEPSAYSPIRLPWSARHGDLGRGTTPVASGDRRPCGRSPGPRRGSGRVRRMAPRPVDPRRSARPLHDLFVFGLGYSAQALVRAGAWTRVAGSVRDPAKAGRLRTGGIDAFGLTTSRLSPASSVRPMPSSSHFHRAMDSIPPSRDTRTTSRKLPRAPGSDICRPPAYTAITPAAGSRRAPRPSPATYGARAGSMRNGRGSDWPQARA